MSGQEITGTVETLTPEKLAEYPEFAEVPKAEWEKILRFYDKAIVRRVFQVGDMICREGAYDYTAYYILKGKAEIFLNSPIAHVKSQKGRAEKKQGFFKGLTCQFNTRLVSAAADEREGERQRKWIPVDATIDLSYEQPIAELGEGDLFGEMSCLSLYPRAASVRAMERCVMLEMNRNVLETLKKRGKSFREKIERNYRERALATQLRSIPEFAILPDEFIEHLQSSVELKSFDPGTVVCEEGDVADSLYLIRLGFVKVLQKYPGGDLVLGYLSRGQYFGEMGLLIGGKRTATCIAHDHVEVVRIGKQDFNTMVQRFPYVRQKLAEEAAKRQAAAARMAGHGMSGGSAAAPVVGFTRQVKLEEYLKQGLVNAQNVLLIDLNKCTRCDECVHACAASHDGVSRLLRDGLRFENFLVTTSCRQCTDPVCMIGCPVGSIRRRESLEVIIEDWCIGCDRCVKQCPYGNITVHDFEVSKLERVYEGQKVVEAESGKGKKSAFIKKATTCDLCLGLDEPSCVYACPHDAAIRVNPEEFFRKLESKGPSGSKAPSSVRLPVVTSVGAEPKPWETGSKTTKRTRFW